MSGMGGHQSAGSESEVWLTPRHVLDALGPFDLDPCAAPDPTSWPTAGVHYIREQNGLSQPWFGRVWMNPPYGGPAIVGPWMRRMAAHGHGIALIFARTETEVFFETVWGQATAILFLRGRLFFHHANGRAAAANAGAPSCLVAYDDDNARGLSCCGLPGHLVRLEARQRESSVDLFEAAE